MTTKTKESPASNSNIHAENNLSARFREVRSHSERLCKPLETEDYVAQPVVDVSPPKWHLGHTTWFFEAFILRRFIPGYTDFQDSYDYIFNSYYIGMGQRVERPYRGNLTRPTVAEVYRYRRSITERMLALIDQYPQDASFSQLVELGLQHEQQHQELLLTDIKYILGHNPLFPVYDPQFRENTENYGKPAYQKMEEGTYEIGHSGDGFCYDNERSRHRVFLPSYEISRTLVSNGEFLEFMQDGGYSRHTLWHSEGWDWLQTNGIEAPMYWHRKEDNWFRYGLSGAEAIDREAPVTHISYYEAYAYAEWSGQRLPSEFEWEAASGLFDWGARWEWTGSAHLPYPGFKKFAGNAGEYNGKFMVNQMVLRGASIASPPGHARPTYRNFFHPHLRWQFTGIRLAR